MKRSSWYLLIGLLLTTILIVYNQLGGFNEINIERVESFNYRVVGKEFKGRISSTEWEDLFYETKGYMDDKVLDGDICIIWYKQPDEEEEVGHAFVGINLSGNQTIPENLELIELKPKGILRAELKGHVLVLPNPEKVINEIKTFAISNGLEIQELVIDRYTGGGNVYTEIPY